MKKWRELNSQETISSTSLMSVRQPWEGLEIESVNSMMNLHQPRWVQCQSFFTLSSSNHCFYPPLFYQLCIMACISFIPSTSTILCQEKPTVLYDLPHHIPLISTSKLYHSFSMFFLTTCLYRLILQEYTLSGKRVSKWCVSKCIQSTPYTYKEKPCKRKSLRAVMTSWNS